MTISELSEASRQRLERIASRPMQADLVTFVDPGCETVEDTDRLAWALFGGLLAAAIVGGLLVTLGWPA